MTFLLACGAFTLLRTGGITGDADSDLHWTSIEIRSRFDTPFPLDLIVRKPEFIAHRERERDMFIELLMIGGQVMYEPENGS